MLEAVFTANVDGIKVSGLTQWDRGQMLKIVCPDLPTAFQVHFTNRAREKAIPVQAVGANNTATVAIPDEILREPFEVLAHLYFTEGDAGLIGETVKTVRMPITPRAQPEDYVVDLTQEQQTAAERMLGDFATAAADKAAQGALSSIQNALDNLPAGDTLVINDLTTGGAAAALSAEMGKVLAYRSVKNLVGNSDFLTPVNQRGTNQYFENASGYCIDLWRKSSNMLVEVKAGGIGLTCSAEATTSNSIAQWLTKDCTPEPGTPLTLAIMDADGEIYVASTSMPDNGSRTSALTLVAGAVYARINAAGYDNASLARLILFVSSGKTIDLKWIALYVGDYTKQTLPNYQSRGYGTELRECQRYQMVFPTTAACQYWLATAQSATQAKICVQLPDTLRSVPALTFDTEVLSLTDNTAVYPVTAASVFAKSGNVVVLNLTTSGLTAGKTYTLRASAATKIIFDANL